jgi:cytochrome c
LQAVKFSDAPFAALWTDLRLGGNKEGQQMDKWLVNMAAGATLSALLVIFGASTFFDIVYPKGGGAEPEPEVAAVDHGGSGGETPIAEPETPFPQLLAAASADAGLKESRKCAACHTFDDGGPNRVGPNLHDVVSRSVAGHEGFAYSPALTEFGGEWTYERLDCYLEDPKGCVPGNKMSFAGIKDESARADLIVYLRSISPNAPPLPEPAQAASAEPASEPAGGAPQNSDNAETGTGNASGQETPEETAPASAVQN